MQIEDVTLRVEITANNMFGRFTKFVRKMGLLQSQTEYTMFYMHAKGKISVLVYVDDIIVTGNNMAEIG